MSIKKLTTAVAKLQALIITLTTALEKAAASTVEMVVGNSYTIITGRAETRVKQVATLVAQRVNEKGTAEYRFSVGEGFDQRFFNCLAAHVVLGTRTLEDGSEVDMLLSQVGGKSPEVIQFELDSANEELVEAQAKLAAEEAKNALVDGQNYTIRLPAKKGEEAVEVLAVLLGQTTEGKKVFNFYYGAGINARTVLRTFSDVVLPGDESEGVEQEVVDTTTPVEQATPLQTEDGELTDAGVAAALAQLGG